MEMKNEADIKKIIEDFFEGKTSNAEEKELYEYFSGDNVAESLKEYRPLFNYLEHEIIDELRLLEDDLSESIFSVEKKKRKGRVYLIALAVVASLLLVLIFKPFSKWAEVNPYEGSYVIENGKKMYIQDADWAEQKEKEILAFVADKEREYYNLYSSIEATEEASHCLEEQALEKERKYNQLINAINLKTKKYEDLLQSIN